MNHAACELRIIKHCHQNLSKIKFSVKSTFLFKYFILFNVYGKLIFLFLNIISMNIRSDNVIKLYNTKQNKSILNHLLTLFSPQLHSLKLYFDSRLYHNNHLHSIFYNLLISFSKSRYLLF